MMRDAIAAAHRSIAAVAGEVSVALATGKLRMSQLKAWSESLRAAGEALERIEGDKP